MYSNKSKTHFPKSSIHFFQQTLRIAITQINDTKQWRFLFIKRFVLLLLLFMQSRKEVIGSAGDKIEFFFIRMHINKPRIQVERNRAKKKKASKLLDFNSSCISLRNAFKRRGFFSEEAILKYEEIEIDDMSLEAKLDFYYCINLIYRFLVF